jgi:DNA transposition AAA+ family ATPase
MKTHAYTTIVNCIKTLQGMKRERPDVIVHAVVYGEWGTGKTRALTEIARNYSLPYWKAEQKLTPNKLIRKLALALGGDGGLFKERNLDIILGILSRKPVPERIFIIDEAQRIYRKHEYLNELKDLGEEIMVSFLFVGDHSIRRYLAETYHSLNKRIFIVELDRIGKESIEAFLKKYQLKGDVETLTKIAKERGLVTLDIDNALFLLWKAQVKEVTPDIFKQAITNLRRA